MLPPWLNRQRTASQAGSPAFFEDCRQNRQSMLATLAQLVEHSFRKAEVQGSSP